MSYDSELAAASRSSRTVKVLTLDYCDKDYAASSPLCEAGLINNPGFETGDFEWWTANDATIENTIVNSGSYSSKLVADGTVIVWGNETPYIAVDETETYLASLYQKVTDYIAGFYHYIIYYYSDVNYSGLLDQDYIGYLNAVADWTYKSRTVGPAGSGADLEFPAGTNFVKFRQQWYKLDSTPEGTGYCDDFRFYKVGGQCYKTRSTCQDADNYVNTVGKEYKFCLKNQPLPFAGQTIRPYLKKEPTYLPTKLDVKNSVAHSAKVTSEFYDEPDNDVGIDPYASDRSTYPNAPGTFWRKFFARNIYYHGRKDETKRGFKGLTEGDYLAQKYNIDQVKVNLDGSIKVISKDPLHKASKVMIPAATQGKVTDNPLSSSSTTVNCDDTSDYGSSGYILIDDEVIIYTGKTATSFTGCTRPAPIIGNILTVAAEHSQDTKIQQCYVQLATNITDVMLDIMQNYLGMSASDINTTSFTDAQTAYLSAYSLTGIISKPTKASVILAELQEHCMGYVIWDEDTQEAILKLLVSGSVGTTYTELTDDDNIIKMTVDNNDRDWLSRVVIYFAKDVLGDIKKRENYPKIHIAWDIAAEGADKYNDEATKSIFSRWLTTASIPNTIVSRIGRRFANPPKKIKVVTELKDSGIKTGDIVTVTTDKIQNVDGTGISGRHYQVLSRQQKSSGTYDFELLDAMWDRKYGNIAPAGQPTWDSASDAEKAYCYIGDATDNILGAARDEGFCIF